VRLTTDPPFPGYRVDVATHAGERTFEVVAWLSERHLVLYVPEIEAATTATAMPEAEDAARSLIVDLTGLDPAAVRCEIRLGRARGGLGGPPTPAV
jgi:hypothetical protein